MGKLVCRLDPFEQIHCPNGASQLGGKEKHPILDPAFVTQSEIDCELQRGGT